MPPPTVNKILDSEEKLYRINRITFRSKNLLFGVIQSQYTVHESSALNIELCKESFFQSMEMLVTIMSDDSGLVSSLFEVMS